MDILFLTQNPNLVSTTRILQSWLLLGRRDGVRATVAVARPGAFADWLAANGIDHRVTPMPWPNRRWPVPAVWHAWRLARWARCRRVAVIHCNEHDVYPFGALVARLARRPVVCHVRCKLDAGFGGWAFRRRPPDALLWSTEGMRQESGPMLGGRVAPQRQHVVPLGLDLDYFGRLGRQREALRASWGVRPDQLVVGMASALRPGKRIEDFVELARRLARQFPGAVFVLAGDVICRTEEEPYHARILPLVRDAERTLPFRWIGHVEPVEPFLHAADVFVSTSEHESFGMSVCEAMGCRRAVAAYEACSVAEVVGDTGLVVPTGDLDGLTAATATLLRDPALRDRLGERARRRVADRFNPSHSLRQLRQIYQSVLGDSPAHNPGSGSPATQVLPCPNATLP
jgi:glycosyltransferase involved in cell wall biosynthesis